MSNSSKWISSFTVGIAVICFLGYLTVEKYSFNVKAIVVIFWLAAILSIITLLFARPKRLTPVFSSVAAWALLWPVSGSACAWSAWWLNGFGP
jgi:hypothetical protein